MANVPKPREDTNSPDTDRPAYGSVDYYADRLRKLKLLPEHVESYALGYIANAVDPDNCVSAGDSERVERIRNILNAAELVRAEQREAAK